ncbi:hypothetical protein BC834DRAFT_211949 [Gloeopeniophorella convolvens]|nr:hypothetical protein BC834DRAFT_211949 [Gloeopeniophorella convolvens]
MTVPDPPWKKRTRPCPFYSQGRCVFAESCGFLHDVKIKIPIDRHFSSPPVDAKASYRDSASSMGSFVRTPPTVTIHPPASSPSPTRSPRMASLLSALQDIIGPDSPEETEEPPFADETPLPPDAPPRGTDPVQGDETHVAAQKSISEGAGAADGSATVSQAPEIADESSAIVDDGSVSGNVTPETTKRELLSPPGLLSPVQLGSGPPVPFPPRVETSGTLTREDSIDSGYAETWVGPTPFALSPPQRSRPSSTLDLLASPFGSPLSRVLPRRLSPSPSRQQATLPPARDSPDTSIDLISPPSLSTGNLQHVPPPQVSPDSVKSASVAPPQEPPLSVVTPNQGVPETADTGEDLDDADLFADDSAGSSPLLFPLPSTEIPVLENLIHTPSSANPHSNHDSASPPQALSDDMLHEDSPPTEALPATTPTADVSPALYGLTEAEPIGVAEAMLSPRLTLDVEVASQSDADAPALLGSPISLQGSAEVGDFDYEALYQSLVMSPEEAASKRMSWVSRPSSQSPAPRSPAMENPLAQRASPVLVDSLERPYSALEMGSRPIRRGSRPTSVLFSEYNSRTSSPLSETPLSSSSPNGSVAPALSRIASPVSPRPGAPHSAIDLRATSPPSASSPSLVSRVSVPNFAPVAGPSRVVEAVSSIHREPEYARKRWDDVSVSKKVPFGFRNSITSERGRPNGVAPAGRKRPSVLTSLPSHSAIGRYKTPESAHSFSSESSQSKPDWAKPLHLSHPSESGSANSLPNTSRALLTLAVDTSSIPSHSQHLSRLHHRIHLCTIKLAIPFVPDTLYQP